MARTVHEILTDAQRIGALGLRPISEVIEHAGAFAFALPGSCRRVVDLGSGAGVPGLVVAELRPELEITLVDRRAKCTDALERAIVSLGWGNRVRVVCADVGALTRQDEWCETFDAAMSRGFGPHETTLKYSAALVRPGGTVLVSEPPAGSANRWEQAVVKGAGLDGPELILHLARFIKKTER